MSRTQISFDVTLRIRSQVRGYFSVTIPNFHIRRVMNITRLVIFFDQKTTNYNIKVVSFGHLCSNKDIFEVMAQ